MEDGAFKGKSVSAIYKIRDEVNGAIQAGPYASCL
jgi:hypothetical protein